MRWKLEGPILGEMPFSQLWRGLWYGEPSGHISHWLLLPSPCHSHTVIFLVYLPWEHGGVLGGEIHESLRGPKICSPQDFLFLSLSILSLQQFIKITIWMFLLAYDPNGFFLWWADLSCGLPGVGVVICPNTSVLWHFQEKSLIFSLFNIIFS